MKLAKINTKLRKNLEEISSKLDILKKANDNTENQRKRKSQIVIFK